MHLGPYSRADRSFRFARAGFTAAAACMDRPGRVRLIPPRAALLRGRRTLDDNTAFPNSAEEKSPGKKLVKNGIQAGSAAREQRREEKKAATPPAEFVIRPAATSTQLLASRRRAGACGK